MFTAARLAAIVGTTLVLGAMAPFEAPVAVERPAFTFGAGDALGVQVRASDVVLARRLQDEHRREAGVATDR